MFQGKLWKDPDSSWWLIEVSFLNVMTQGRTRKEALEMLKDAIMELLEDAYKDLLHEKLQLTITLHEGDVINIKATDDTLLFALGLKRKRFLSN